VIVIWRATKTQQRRRQVVTLTRSEVQELRDTFDDAQMTCTNNLKPEWLLGWIERRLLSKRSAINALIDIMSPGASIVVGSLPADTHFAIRGANTAHFRNAGSTIEEGRVDDDSLSVD
jgi:hypothetical protein